MKNRAEKALTFLENQNEENILVVTHGDFLICLMGVIIFGNNLEAKSNLKFGETFISNNTGITVFEHIDRWRIRTWNDHAHLGDLNTA